MTSPTSALPLARLVAERAYKAGAGLVTTIFSDEEMTLARYRYANDASFDRAPAWTACPLIDADPRDPAAVRELALY